MYTMNPFRSPGSSLVVGVECAERTLHGGLLDRFGRMIAEGFLYSSGPTRAGLQEFLDRLAKGGDPEVIDRSVTRSIHAIQEGRKVDQLRPMFEEVPVYDRCAVHWAVGVCHGIPSLSSRGRVASINGEYRLDSSGAAFEKQFDGLSKLGLVDFVDVDGFAHVAYQ